MDIGQSDIYWRIQSANEDERERERLGFPSNTPTSNQSQSAAANLGLNSNSALSNPPSRSQTPLVTTPLGGGPTSMASGAIAPFDPMEHALASSAALDPRAFSSNFILPRFASGGPAGNFGFGMAIAEPELTRETLNAPLYSNAYAASPTPSSFSFTNGPPVPTSSNPSSNPASASASAYAYRPSPSAQSQSQSFAPPQPMSHPPQPTPPPVGSYQYFPSPSNPVYTPYGSSIVTVNPSPTPYKIPLTISLLQPPLSTAPSHSPTSSSSNTSNNTGTGQFDPSSLSLPVPPPPGTTTNFAGLYSSSGFDMLSVLARVAARPHQSIQIGPVDTSCAFLVVDARKWDMPIVFASETFTKMTGYRSDEIMGRNCRFLQSPDGLTVQGTPRKYTDGNAAWHMRTHITAGKESQSSLINYMKGGRPFINLVTIIPISWDTDEIAYYVGFQVDLVDQPNAILDRMKDGTYVVNYSLLNQPTKTMSMMSVDVSSVGGGSVAAGSINGSGLGGSGGKELGGREWSESIEAGRKMSLTLAEGGGGGGGPAENEEREARAMLDCLEKGNVRELMMGENNGEQERKILNKLLLDNSDDFIHVLSLKGSLLYCSPSAAQILEYEPSQLVGKTLSALCHPSDVIPALRELKESGSVSHSHVSLLYRIRRKNSGYIWIEASGKLHIEPGKGRKCVILVGRPREVYKMSWNAVRRSGGLGDAEFWNKLSPEGMVLSSTANVQNVLGFSQAEMVGTSLFQLAKTESIPEIRQALLTCSNMGTAVTVRYQIKSRRGFVEVVTRFYPRKVDPLDDEMPIENDDEQSHGPRHVSIIAQTNELSSELRKDKGSFFHQAPAYHSALVSPPSDSLIGSMGLNPGFMQSTFKTLAHPSAVSDNVFDELDTTRCTSWQYELHQLENINKKLREEKEHLISVHRKRRSDFAQLAAGGGLRAQQGLQTLAGNGTSDGASSSKASLSVRSCANCGRTDSPEWRAGPTGTRSLCNACGLRWAKTQRSSAGGSAATGGTGGTGGTGADRGRRAATSVSSTSASKSPSFSPYNESIESSASPVGWR